MRLPYHGGQYGVSLDLSGFACHEPYECVLGTSRWDLSDGAITEQPAPVREEVASFAMLGAGVPFTSQRLLGARIRLVPLQRDFELVLINPAQAKGSYIIPWKGLPEIGSPTLFDLRLWETLSKAKEIHPSAIRNESLAVSLEGLAGRHAANAAQEALREGKENRRRMIAAFINQSSGGPKASMAMAANLQPDQPEQVKAQQALAARSPVLMQHLNALASTLAFIGPGTASSSTPLRRLMREISAMVDEMRARLSDIEHTPEAAAFRFLIEASEATLHYAELALRDLEAKLGDFVDLLAHPGIDAAKILDRARRPEWILDGWGILIALWRRTDPLMRSGIIWDLVSLVPAMPREIQDWFSAEHGRKAPARISRLVMSGTDWRTGQSHHLTERNEDLVSFSLHYENRVTPMADFMRRSSSLRTRKYRGSSRSLTHPGHMGGAEGSKLPEGLAALMENLGNASDDNLLRIVAMIDRLPARGKLDPLLNDVRPRLAQLRPPRPVTFTRLLFLPLAGALVDQADWRRAPEAIPRTALHLISALINEFLGEATQGLAEALRPAVFSDFALVERFGRPLWDGAGRVAERVTPDQRWVDAGFSPEDFHAIMRLCRGVWRHADAMWDVLRLGDSAVSPDTIKSALTGPAADSLSIFSAVFSTLLRGVRNPAVFASLVAGGMPPGTSDMAVATLENWIEGALPKLADLDPAEAAEHAEELGKMVETLGQTPFFQIPRRRKLLSSFFWRLEEHCRVHFLEVVNEQVLTALKPSSTPFSDIALTQLERQSRAARRLEILGRHFGNDPSYEEAHQRLIKAFGAARRNTEALAVTPVDLLRLGEILLGREKARALLSV